MNRFSNAVPVVNRRGLLRFGAAAAAGTVAGVALSAEPASALTTADGARALSTPLAPAAAGSPFGLSPTVVAAAATPTIDVGQLQAARGKLVNIPTYEGSGVVVHPSVYYAPDGWNGHKYWMAYTPYPSSNNQIENPSLVCSDDGDNWSVPQGGKNPVVGPVSDPAGGYNSDVNLFVDVAGLMYMFWRMNTYDGRECHFVVTSKNGVTWSDQIKVRQDAQSVRRLLAPSYIQLGDGSWVVYAVDAVRAPRTFVRATAPALSGPWTTPQICAITGNSAIPWHVDVHRVGDEWQALVQSNVSDGSAGDLWAMVSQDGVNFTAGSKVMPRGTAGVDWDASYYKSAFVPTVRNGVAGWDTWLGGGTFPASGQIVGRTFISFSAPAPVLVSESAPTTSNKTVEVLAAKNGLPPWIASDTFARADAASLGVSESGQSWSFTIGSFKIAGKGAAPTATANTRAHLDVGIANAMATVEITGPNTVQHWLVARLVDGGNYYRLGIASDGRLALEKVAGGGVVALATVLRTPPASGTEISLRCDGPTIQAYVDGTLAATVSDSTHAGTSFGIQASSTTAKLRNFRVRAL